MTPIIIRFILSGLLLWGVYTETGLFTTIAMTLIMITCELQAFINKTKD